MSKIVSSSLQVEDDGTAIAKAVRNVMDLTFDPIGKQPYFVGMTKMCHQVMIAITILAMAMTMTVVMAMAPRARGVPAEYQSVKLSRHS